MIVYSGVKREFLTAVEQDSIAAEIEENIYNKMHRKTAQNEFRSWENSLEYMYKVLNDSAIPDNSGIAIEYNIPQTSKRVDFIISGYGENQDSNVVIIELKQWDKVEAVEGQDALVETFTGGAVRKVVHPSYQAWSYAVMIYDYPVYMDADEAKIYADMEEDLFIPLKKGEITAANAATLSGKLLQMANGAVYSDEGDEIVIHDQKLDALEDMIEAANGRPVMVAYWFKHDLSRIMRRLTEKKIPFEKLDSEESIRKWNRGELPVALIHPASAGHGLNLQSGGNMLIWFGLTWSLELYQQTVARLWRQGQTAETVVVQHIITAGTIDEDVMKALANKDMTQNRLIAAVKARVTHGR